jgi:GMP synthase (glutamine-hydrolysing)
MSRVLVLDFHVNDPPFSGPRWFPAGTVHETVRVTRGGRPADPGRWSHVVLSGSALTIVEDPPFYPEIAGLLREVVAHGTPVMGVCYGCQLLARIFLGREHVRRNPQGVEVGWLPVEVLDDADGWFAGLPRPFHTWQFHYDEVCDLPAGCRRLARSPRCEVQAWDDPARRLVGFQFHPEMDVEEGNRYFRAEAEKIRSHGLDPEDLVAATRDDGARIVFSRFLTRPA